MVSCTSTQPCVRIDNNLRCRQFHHLRLLGDLPSFISEIDRGYLASTMKEKMSRKISDGGYWFEDLIFKQTQPGR